MHIKHLPAKYKAFCMCLNVWLSGSRGDVFCAKGFCATTQLAFSACEQSRQTLLTAASDGSASAYHSELGEGQGQCESKRQRQQLPNLQTRGYANYSMREILILTHICC